MIVYSKTLFMSSDLLVKEHIQINLRQTFIEIELKVLYKQATFNGSPGSLGNLPTQEADIICSLASEHKLSWKFGHACSHFKHTTNLTF